MVEGMIVRPRRRWYRRPGPVISLSLTVIVVGTVIVSYLNPWPSSLLVRVLFEDDAHKTVDEMLPYVPEGAVTVRKDIPYADDGSDTTFDLFLPQGEVTPRPTVVWIHGGAWISGSKKNVEVGS